MPPNEPPYAPNEKMISRKKVRQMEKFFLSNWFCRKMYVKRISLPSCFPAKK